MKKIKNFLAMVMAVICAVFIFGCQESIPSELSEEAINNIRLAWFNLNEQEDSSLDKIIFKKYLGTYDNNVVVEIVDKNAHAIQAEWDFKIDDVLICRTTGERVFSVYRNYNDNYANGDFILLQTAYQQGIITKDNLYSIADLAQNKQALS